MLFGGEPRFRKDLKPLPGGNVFVYSEPFQTYDHLGPGAYHSTQFEDVRSGWVPKGYSRRQPFSPQARRVDRNHHYTAGVLVSTGIANPGSPMSRSSPGPGYYGGPVVSPTSRGFRNRPTSAMGSSQRMAPGNAVLKDGVLFQSMNNGIDLGPGYYNADAGTMEKKSHNIRALRSSADRSFAAGGGGASRSPATSPMGKNVPMSPSFEWSNQRSSQQSGSRDSSLRRAQSAPRLRRGGPGGASGTLPNFGYETPIAPQQVGYR